MAIGSYVYNDGVTFVQPWYGDIATARIYNKPMTEGEIATSYAAAAVTINALNSAQ